MTKAIRGSCLCGNIAFQISGALPKIYQCHCSLCRKVSGSASNAAMLVVTEAFQWIEGEQEIASYATASGFKSDFCHRCGSPVPNLTRDQKKYWIPAGLLDQSDSLNLAAHVYVNSRATWDRIIRDIPHFQEMPDEDTLNALLSPDTTD